MFSVLFRGQRTLASFTANWMMKRSYESALYHNKSKIPRTKMDQSTDNKSKFAHESRHASSSNITQVTGDLFSCSKTHSLSHCISADVKMGRGIAVTFKQEFGGVPELLSQNQRPGGLAILERDERFIYYLVTKERYWDKPTYDTLRSSLERMRDHNVKYKVRELCMPKIGCGLDKLQWHRVLALIRDVYKGLDIQITIYHFDDGKKDTAKGSGRQRTLDGYEEDRWRNQPWRPESRTRDDAETKADEERETQTGFNRYKEDRHQRSSHHNMSAEHRSPESGRGYPPSNQRRRDYGSGKRYPQGSSRRREESSRTTRDFSQGGSTAQSYCSGKGQEFRQQSNIQSYFAISQPGSRKGEETSQEEFLALSESGKSKQNDKKNRRNEGVVKRDQQNQTFKDKNSTSPPVKIDRSSNYHKHETRGSLGNDGASTDAKKDGTERKVHENKGRKDEKNDGKYEGSNQEANKNSEQSNVCVKEREDKERYQKTTNDSQEQRKGSRDEDRDEHDKGDQTCPEQDKVLQDTDKSKEQTEQSKTLKDKESLHSQKETSNAIIRNESHSESKNSDAVSSASASESTVRNTPQRQERDGGDDDKRVTSTDENAAKSIQEQGEDYENDEKEPSGSADETPNRKKKRKKKKKKKKSSEEYTLHA